MRIFPTGRSDFSRDLGAPLYDAFLCLSLVRKHSRKHDILSLWCYRMTSHGLDLAPLEDNQCKAHSLDNVETSRSGGSAAEGSAGSLVLASAKHAPPTSDIGKGLS